MFYFVILHASGLESYVLDEGQPTPANMVRRAMIAQTIDDAQSYN